METAGYSTLSRQSGLMREMQIVANNIANTATAGYRREGLIFAEHVVRLDQDASLSMADGQARSVDQSQGALAQTGGTYDLAIQGPGYFLIATPDGERLTRAGAFVPTAEGVLATADGHPLLDAGGAPVPVPLGARSIMIARDGTLSADGRPVAGIGLWQPVDPSSLQRDEGASFSATDLEPVEEANIHQGFLEESNVDPVGEVARMIEVQRAYEAGQRFLDAEDQRQKTVVQTLGR